ncbi:carbohydrate kinase [Prevotella sp. P5-126]|uniref:Carbohydrate kinase n=1 Tax=Xylanibacter brevis TaxID=83231 RepID=A0ABS9CC63_9BACT|nr:MULTISPECIES: carbohydrate kinase [Prevotellaceae]MBS7319650.1 carbohydrate kinase [Prevotella sp.]MCF2558499.1 carbohydrate kinase [Xylanibacter brevis]MCF2562718.1 carbohydrate kinase [Xylanibacter brevis]MCI7002120.1 carbohydrate kinase [Prevotella sp.]MDD7172471.1 carbohydrate kinase [Prevotella sp.]
MRKVIGIGETVLDIIFRDEKPISALPGGSTFNAIISLGRSGVKASMISETGNDRIGQNIIKFMESNGIDASYVNVYPESKSPLSLAFLNDHNDADYIFYKDHPHDRIDYVYPEVNADDIVLFGSFFALNPVIRPQVYAFLDYARQRGAILYYDVNFRASHKNEVMKVTPNLLDNLEMADIVRGSSEDFEILFRQHDADTVYRSQIAFYTKKFIYTRSADPVEVRGDSGFSKQYPVLPTETVSTIGAGDNFNAGFIYGLIKNGITRQHIDQGLTESQWDALVSSALDFSAECCRDIYNYVSEEYGEKMRKGLQNNGL